MEQQLTNEQLPCLSGAAPAAVVRRKRVRYNTRPAPPQIVDAAGILWQVREARATECGFDLLLGHPMPGVRRRRRPKGHIIPTRQLVEYWRLHSSDSRACFNLPASYAALRRLYLRQGFRLVRYVAPTPRNPVADLKNLPAAEFAELYQIPMSAVLRWRAIFLEYLRNPRKRSTRAVAIAVIQSSLTNQEVAEGLGLTTGRVCAMRRNLLRRGAAYHDAPKPVAAKWNTPAVLAVLHSGQSTAQMARDLGISPSHAHRLRKTFASP